jgi:non-homologous end joining protein Ku
MKLIETKARKGEAGLPKAKKARTSSKVIDLTDVLKQSLSEVSGSKGKTKSKKKKRASKRRKKAA